MDTLQLIENVKLAAPTAQLVHVAAVALAASLATLALCLTSFRALLLGDGRAFGDWLLRLVLVVALLGAYEQIINTVLTASDELASYFAQRAGWDSYWDTVAASFEPLMQEQDPAWARLLGWARGGALSAVVSVSYYLQFMVFEMVRYLASVFAALLYVFGPLMIAGGLLGGGRSVLQWASSLIQVAVWPSVPPFLMLIIVGTGGNAVESGNVPYIVAQNVTLTLLGLLSPAIVAFVFGRGGMVLFASAAMGVGARALGAVVQAVQHMSTSGAAAAAAAGAGGAASSVVAGGAGANAAMTHPVQAGADGARPDDAHEWLGTASWTWCGDGTSAECVPTYEPASRGASAAETTAAGGPLANAAEAAPKPGSGSSAAVRQPPSKPDVGSSIGDHASPAASGCSPSQPAAPLTRKSRDD